MKSIPLFCYLLLAGVSGALAQEAPVVTLESYTKAANKILDHLESYNKLLASVKDLPTAKTAKTKLEALTKEMATAATDAHKLQPVPAGVQEAYEKEPKVRERAGVIMNDFSASGRTIITNKAIFAELQPVLAEFQRAMTPGAKKPEPPKAPATPPKAKPLPNS